MDNEKKLDEEKKDNRIIKELVEEQTFTDDKIQEEIHSYVDKKIDYKINEMVSSIVQEKTKEYIEKMIDSSSGTAGFLNMMIEKMVNQEGVKIDTQSNDNVTNKEEGSWNNKINSINYKSTMSKLINNNLDKSTNIIHSNINDYKITSNLKKIMDEMRITQTLLAEMTGISRGTVITILKNPESITLKNAYKIAYSLKMQIPEIFPFIH